MYTCARDPFPTGLGSAAQRNPPPPTHTHPSLSPLYTPQLALQQQYQQLVDAQTTREGQAAVAEEYDHMQRETQSKHVAELNEMLLTQTSTVVEAEAFLTYSAINLLLAGWQPSPEAVNYQRARLERQVHMQAMAANAAANAAAAAGAAAAAAAAGAVVQCEQGTA